jgi:hypothetical protein
VRTIPAGLLTHYQGQVQTIAFCTQLTLSTRQPRVVNITKTNPAIVTTLSPHFYREGMNVKFTGIERMTQINDQYAAILSVISPKQVSINIDATAFSDYAAGSNFGTMRRVLGFTEFEKNLVIDGVTYWARTGSKPSAMDLSSDLSFSTRDLHALLNSDEITAVDIERGLYSGAEYETFEINYLNIAAGKHVLEYGRLGDITYGDVTFVAEGHGLLSMLAQNGGPITSITCRAQFGNRIKDIFNERFGCKIRLNPYTWQPNKSYTAVEPFDAARGDIVKPSIYNGRYFKCTAAGVSGPAEPTWSTAIGSTTADGGVIWTAIDALTKEGTVTGSPQRDIVQDKNRTEIEGRFTFGLFTFTDGRNGGFSTEVKKYSRTQYPIILVDVANKYFYVTGDKVQFFTIGDAFPVSGSPANDGTYTVTAVIYEPGPNRTRITVAEAIPSSSAGGVITWRPGAIVLRDTPLYPVDLGDPYLIEVGCDHRFDTCKTFDNVYNFRGEPWIPGVHQQFMFPNAPK